MTSHYPTVLLWWCPLYRCLSVSLFCACQFDEQSGLTHMLCVIGEPQVSDGARRWGREGGLFCSDTIWRCEVECGNVTCQAFFHLEETWDLCCHNVFSFKMYRILKCQFENQQWHSVATEGIYIASQKCACSICRNIPKYPCNIISGLSTSLNVRPVIVCSCDLGKAEARYKWGKGYVSKQACFFYLSPLLVS